MRKQNILLEFFIDDIRKNYKHLGGLENQHIAGILVKSIIATFKTLLHSLKSWTCLPSNQGFVLHRK